MAIDKQCDFEGGGSVGRKRDAGITLTVLSFHS